MDRAEIMEKLHDSLDMRCIRRRALLGWPGLALAVLAVAGLRGGAVGDEWPVVVAVCLVFGLGFLVWWLYRRWKICRCPEGYTFHQVVLDQPHWGDRRDGVYFTVTVEKSDGSTVAVDTRDIFVNNTVFGPRPEDYINKTITIAYNEKTKMVVVIG